MEISHDVEKGQAVYSKLTLSFYDFWVLGISNRYIWKCPTDVLLRHFNEHVSSNHLDIGVGTGYFLDHCQFPTDNVRLGLMDLNQNSLDCTARRVRRYNPEQYRCNVLEPVAIDVPPYNSISLNYLLHCLPGSFNEKSCVFDNIDHLLGPHGNVFGATIVQGTVRRGWLAQKLMHVYNQKGIFCNADDTVEYLGKFLSTTYSSYTIECHGCVAVFHASK